MLVVFSELVNDAAMSALWTSLLGDVVSLASERGVGTLLAGDVAVASNPYWSARACKLGLSLRTRKGKMCNYKVNVGERGHGSTSDRRATVHQAIMS